MTTFPGPYLYLGPCGLVLPAHQAVVGDPPPGSYWVCSQAGGTGSGAVVYASPLVVATYLIQHLHLRASVQDAAITTYHWRWEGGAAPVAADFEAVETRINSFWTAISTYITTMVTSREYRWYGPRTEPGLWGEAIRVTPVAGSGGSATAGLPQQIACSVTERTDVRKRWGRFYIPNLGTNTLASGNEGIFSTTFRNAVRDAAATLLGTDVGEFAPVVFGAPSPSSLAVRAIAVDQIPDVQRRRRFESSATGVVTSFV